MGELNLKNIKKEFQGKGVFYTPKEICEYMRTFFPEEVSEIYDPTCGQGNLFEVFADSTVKYGQDISEEEVEKARQRLKNFNGVVGDTLKQPAWIDKKFDYIIANYPYSISWEQELFKEDPRFKDLPALPPKSKADFAFIAHILYMLSDNGIAAVLGFPGILYRGASEEKIRKYIIDKNYVEKVILIPGNKFVDTSISTVLIIFNKHKDNTNIEFIDRATNTSHTATFEEVKNNKYNLAVNSYINTNEEDEEIDILAVGKEHRELQINLMYNMLKNAIWLLKASKYYDGFTEQNYTEEDLKNIRFIYSLASLFDMFFNVPSSVQEIDDLMNPQKIRERIGSEDNG